MKPSAAPTSIDAVRVALYPIDEREESTAQRISRTLARKPSQYFCLKAKAGFKYFCLEAKAGFKDFCLEAKAGFKDFCLEAKWFQGLFPGSQGRFQYEIADCSTPD